MMRCTRLLSGATLRSGVAALVACALVASLGGCALNVSATLAEYPEGSGGIIVLHETRADETYGFDDLVVCAVGEGTIEVTSVDLVESNGMMEVVSFSVLPAREGGDTLTYLTDHRQRLVDVGFPSAGPMIIDRSCATDATGRPSLGDAGSSIVGFEVRRTSDAPGTARGVEVTYLSGDQTHSTAYPFGVVLCDDFSPDGPEGPTNERCEIEQLTSW